MPHLELDGRNYSKKWGQGKHKAAKVRDTLAEKLRYEKLKVVEGDAAQSVKAVFKLTKNPRTVTVYFSNEGDRLRMYEEGKINQILRLPLNSTKPSPR